MTGGDTTASGDIDIVFTIDTTGSMGSYIAQVKQYAQSLIDQVNAQTNSARFALVSYRDDPAWTGYSGDYPARVESGFTTDPTALKSAINGLSVNGGGDWPETMYSGVDAALDLPWRPGVKKVVIVLADAPPHDPEPISGLTGQDVIDHALAVDPAEVYVVDTGSAVSSSLANVVSSTGGSRRGLVDRRRPERCWRCSSQRSTSPTAGSTGPTPSRSGCRSRSTARAPTPPPETWSPMPGTTTATAWWTRRPRRRW
ncbi:MAG: VWA domain-containing protein [Nocardioides sp.]